MTPHLLPQDVWLQTKWRPSPNDMKPKPLFQDGFASVTNVYVCVGVYTLLQATEPNTSYLPFNQSNIH